MPTANVGGIGLHYELQGTDGPPLVLVHGSWGDHRNWARVVPAFAASCRVLTYDRRGHSASDRPSGQGSIEDDARDLVSLLEHLGHGPAHVVGSSFGGAVVLHAAAAWPDSFRSMAVHEPPLFGLLADSSDMQAPLAAARARIEAVVALLERGETAAGAQLFVDTIAFGPGAWAQLDERMRATFVGNALTWLDEIRDPGARTVDVKALARFETPTMLSHGDQSPPFFPLVADRIARAMPRARRHVFSGAAHVPHLTHAAEYVRVVLDFVMRER